MRRLLAWAPAVAWAAAIFWVSHQSSVRLPGFTLSDKVGHLAAYTLLAILLCLGARAWGLSPVWVLVLGILYGVSDEFHQSFVPGRSAELGDLIADSLGVLLGTFLFQRWAAWRGNDPAARPATSASP